jgi:predicted phage terminase large subunit-like protein
MTLKKQELDKWLNEVDYSILNSSEYVPSEFALIFMNFIKLVNGAQGESHKTPPVHLAMLDKVAGKSPYIANLCFRGAAKTTLFMEYMSLFIAVFGYLPGFGRVEAMIYVSDSMENGVKSARKNIEFRYNNSDFLQTWLPHAHFTDNYIEFGNKDGLKLGIKLFGAKTGIRGTKIFGKRPVLAVLDDLVNDEDANSKAAMIAIKNTVYKGVNHALDPVRRKMIFNGTPFNKEDILIEAVESGGWDVNVWPVCEKFPCTEAEFKGAWSDRFTYDYIKAQYEMAIATGKVAAFNQELMLRITSDENRLIQDEEIRWYPRTKLLETKSSYNFYITTDIAVSAKQRADRSVISVWAYNANGDWFWVDGIVHRKLIDQTWNELFKFVSEYKPQHVGIEVTGQQKAFITTLQTEMMTRNIWFNFASSEKNNEPGIRPMTDKLARLNLVVPWFKAGKVYFPQELKTSVLMGEYMQELRLATSDGLKGKDDCIDTISMLGYLKPWKPSDNVPGSSEDERWEEPAVKQVNPLSSYIV